MGQQPNCRNTIGFVEKKVLTILPGADPGGGGGRPPRAQQQVQ